MASGVLQRSALRIGERWALAAIVSVAALLLAALSLYLVPIVLFAWGREQAGVLAANIADAVTGLVLAALMLALGLAAMWAGWRHPLPGATSTRERAVARTVFVGYGLVAVACGLWCVLLTMGR